jgi:tetratricopeptide (TPR) repeat protein
LRDPKTPPRLTLLHQLMMRVEWHAGDIDRARMHAEALLAAGGEQTAAKLVILHQLKQRGELAEAAARINALLDPLPRRRGARARLLLQAARIAAEAGEMAAARHWAKLFLALRPGHRQALKLLHRAGVKILSLDEQRAEISAWVAHGGKMAQVAAPAALRLAFHEDKDWRAVIEHANRLRDDDLEATTHRILALALLADFEAADAALASARAATRGRSNVAMFRDELALAEANIAQRAGDVQKQLACINRLLSQHALAPIALRTDASPPLAPMSVNCDPAGVVSTGPRVAVVMTVYGRDDETALRAAVGSILGQSYRNLELILVDDCSPDDTLSLLHSLVRADPRVHVFQTPVNGGTYRAKNLGITQTNAELVAFMDSDDWSHPQRLERQVQSLTAHAQAMAVVHNSIRIEPDGWIEFRQRASRFAYISTMLRRTVIEELGYFDAVRVSGDAEMIARIRSFYGPEAVRHEPLPTVLMARRAGSLTGGGMHYIGWRSVTGDRWRYHRAFKHWHQRCRADGRTPYVDICPAERPFPAPPSVVGTTDAPAPEPERA